MTAENDSTEQTAPRSLASLLGCCAWLLFALLLFAVPVAWYAHSQHGGQGILAAAVAGLLCFVAGSLALWSTWAFTGVAAVQGVLLGMIFRFGLPLAGGVLLSLAPGPLREAGILNLVLVNYLFMLAVETALALRLVPQSANKPHNPAANVTATKTSQWKAS